MQPVTCLGERCIWFECEQRGLEQGNKARFSNFSIREKRMFLFSFQASYPRATAPFLDVLVMNEMNPERILFHSFSIIVQI